MLERLRFIGLTLMNANTFGNSKSEYRNPTCRDLRWQGGNKSKWQKFKRFFHTVTRRAAFGGEQGNKRKRKKKIVGKWKS